MEQLSLGKDVMELSIGTDEEEKMQYRNKVGGYCSPVMKTAIGVHRYRSISSLPMAMQVLNSLAPSLDP
jgi:hypothetical protein